MSKIGKRPRAPWLASRLAAVAGVAVLTSVAACGSTATTPPQSGTKFTHTIAPAGMAYIQVHWHGWVRASSDIPVSDTEHLAAGTYGPYDAVTSCSGFIASRSGDVVTAGHCVDATSFYGGKGAILAAMMAVFKHADGQPLTAAEQASQAQILDENATVEGTESGSPVDRTVNVTEPAVSAVAYPADVVSVQPFTQGDVALLRATGLHGSVLTVAQATPENGDSIVAAGYPGDVAATVDSTTPASFIDGTVSGTQTVNGTPFTQISAQVSPGMSGGPVLNMAGQVVGTVSWAPSGAAEANFMTDVGSIRSLLASNGVNNTLTPADRALRQGLAYYFASRYHEAVKQLDLALALQPGLTIAKDYRQRAVTNYPADINPPSSGLPQWAYVAIGGAVVILAGGAGIMLMRRRRARPSGKQPATPVASPMPPEPTPEHQAVQEPARMAKPPEQELPARPQTRLYCQNCGLPHTEEAHYCERCGQPFPWETPSGHGIGGGVRE